MSEQAQEQATPEATAKPEATPVESQETNKSVTWDEHQRELTRVGTKEKKEGKSARNNELVEKWAEYGIESLDDVEAVLDAQRTIEAELEGEQITDLKKQHKAEIKALQQEFDSYKEALQGYLDKEREGLPEHITEVLDGMSAPDQLAYISKHGEAIRTETRPATVGRGSSPGSASASRADVTPGLGRLKVAYETRSPS